MASIAGLGFTVDNVGGTPYINVLQYGVKGDVRGASDGAMTSGQRTFSSPSASFLQTDVGKVLVVYGANSGSGDGLITTINGILSPTSVLTADAAGATVSNAHYCYGTDDTAALNAALVAAAKINNNQWGFAGLPVGRFMCKGQITIPAGANLCGLDWGPFDISGPPDQQAYAPTLIIANTATTAINFSGGNGGLSDVAIYYPAQVMPTASTPVSYPYTITFPTGSAGNHLYRCSIINGYDGLDIAGGRHFISDMALGCLHSGWRIDHSQDVVHMKSIHVGVYWDSAQALAYPQTLDTWVQANRTMGNFFRADNPQLVDIFGFIGNVGLNFDDSTDGSQSPKTSYGCGNNIVCDTFNTGIVCKSTNAVGWALQGVMINASSTASVQMASGGGTAPKLNITGGTFWGSHVSVLNTAGGCAIKGVIGFNPQGSQTPPGFPSSGVATSNPFPTEMLVTIACGVGVTVSAVGIGAGQPATGLTIAASSQASVILAPNQGIKITYSGGTPTWTWFGV